MFGTQSYGRRGLALLTSLLLILLQLAAPLGALATETADVPAVYVSYTDANGLTGSAMGRQDRSAITLFDSVGFAIEDFSALRYVHGQLRASGLFQDLDMIADPDDPRDLFGMLLRAG